MDLVTSPPAVTLGCWYCSSDSNILIVTCTAPPMQSSDCLKGKGAVIAGRPFRFSWLSSRRGGTLSRLPGSLCQDRARTPAGPGAGPQTALHAHLPRIEGGSLAPTCKREGPGLKGVPGLTSAPLWMPQCVWAWKWAQVRGPALPDTMLVLRWPQW